MFYEHIFPYALRQYDITNSIENHTNLHIYQNQVEEESMPLFDQGETKDSSIEEKLSHTLNLQ